MTAKGTVGAPICLTLQMVSWNEEKKLMLVIQCPLIHFPRYLGVNCQMNKKRCQQLTMSPIRGSPGLPDDRVSFSRSLSLSLAFSLAFVLSLSLSLSLSVGVSVGVGV
jgi:hypothetical protein